MEKNPTSDGFILSDAITDMEDRFPFKELLALEYFIKYRGGYHKQRELGVQVNDRNYYNLLKFLAEIHEYRADDARAIVKRLRKGGSEWRNCEAIFAEIIVYRYYVRLAYEGIIRSVSLGRAECDVIVERLDGTAAYLEPFSIMPGRKQLRDGEISVKEYKTHTQDDPASIRQKPLRKITKQGQMRDAGIANRTINMDVGVLSRVLKFCGRWRALADHVKNLPERQRPIGRALTSEERRRLFDVAASNPEWEHVYCAAIVAANTSMRSVEVKHIRRCDVDLVKRLLHVRRSKNETSHRVIPLNASAIEAVARMLERADLLGHMEPGHYLWPACQWGRYDPTKPMLQWDTAWRALRDGAGLHGLRFHDLRHTVITELAEMGVADHVLESISGHLSRRMLEHYSHIRIDAKRQALDALDQARRAAAGNGNGNQNEADDAASGAPSLPSELWRLAVAGRSFITLLD